MTIKEQDMAYIHDCLSPEERERFSGSTLLITGCGGFLGYYFMNFFQACGRDLGIRKVIGLDNFMLGRPAWIEELASQPGFEIRKFDMI